MKYTLLEIVSDILSDMDSDFVDSINDTDEATQVAQIVKTTYQAMMSNRNWPISVFYDCRKTLTGRLDFRQMKYLEPDAFLRYINQRNSTDPNTLTISDPSGIILLITSNKAPEYFTSFDDTNIVFDSYDSVMDTTLQGSKTQARAYTIPEFEMVDSFIPDLPDEAFSALIEEAKSKAMFKLKQTQDIKAEQEANRQQRWLSRKAWRVHEQDIYPFNYGRNTRGGSYRKDPTFRREN
jgi:hypothetical protein